MCTSAAAIEVNEIDKCNGDSQKMRFHDVAM